MGLRDEIQNELSEDFNDDLADAVSPFVGERTTTKEDFLTGGVTKTTVSYTGRGIFDDYNARDIDGTVITALDKMLIVLANEVTETPQVGDKINDYNVVNVNQDPASATYTIQLRQV